MLKFQVTLSFRYSRIFVPKSLENKKGTIYRMNDNIYLSESAGVFFPEKLPVVWDRKGCQNKPRRKNMFDDS